MIRAANLSSLVTNQVYVYDLNMTEISVEMIPKYVQRREPWSEIEDSRKSEKRPKPKNARKVRKTVRKILPPSVIRIQGRQPMFFIVELYIAIY